MILITKTSLHFNLTLLLALLLAAASCASAPAAAERSNNESSTYISQQDIINSGAETTSYSEDAINEEGPGQALRMMNSMLSSMLEEAGGGAMSDTEAKLIPGKGLVFTNTAARSASFFVTAGRPSADENEATADATIERMKEAASEFIRDYARTGMLERDERVTVLITLLSTDTDHLIERRSREGNITMLSHRAPAGEVLYISATAGDIQDFRTGSTNERRFASRMDSRVLKQDESLAYRRMNEVIGSGLSAHPETPYSYTRPSVLYVPGTGLILSGEIRRDWFSGRISERATITINGVTVDPDIADQIREIRVSGTGDSVMARFITGSADTRDAAVRIDSLAQVNRVRADSIRVFTEVRLEELRDQLAPSLQALREGLIEFHDTINPTMEQLVREVEATSDSLRPALREVERRVSGVASSFATTRQRQQHVYYPERNRQYPNDDTSEAVDFLKQQFITLFTEYGHTLRELQDDDIILLNFSLRGGATGFAGRDVPLKLSVKTSDLRNYISGQINRDQLAERFTLL